MRNFFLWNLKYRKLRFLGIEGIYFKKGHEADLYSLMEGVMARKEQYLALLIMDVSSPVFKVFKERKKLGPLNTILGSFNADIYTKSGIMVGLGEDKAEIDQVMDDLRSSDVDFLTIGQYLQPSIKHYPLDRYYTPKEFEDLGTIAKAKGFLLVSSSPLTRSSYHADEDFAKLQQNRINQH